MNTSESGKKRILVANDKKDMLEMLDERLSRAGYEIFRASSGREVLSKVKAVLPDLILMDIVVSGMDSMGVKSKLSEDTSFSGIPVIFLTGEDDILRKSKDLSSGVDDYVTRPIEHEELLARIDSVLDRKKFFERISMTDSLTGLYNILYLKKQIVHMISMAKRYKHVFSLAVMDIDNLKRINSFYNQAIGDLVMRKIASILQWRMREADIITRHSENGFAVLLPATEKTAAIKAMRRIKDKISNRSLYIETRKVEVWPAVSIGIAAYDDAVANENQLLEEARTKQAAV